MDQAQWARLQDLFSEAVELSGAERGAFVSHATANDTELHKELLELLECDSGDLRSPITRAMGAALDATTRERRKALVGKTIGNYRLLSMLGHGGAGTVYLAERGDPEYSTKVALKLVDTVVHGHLGARFRAERQILASLNHPNISRLLDAGETDEGQPYLVMEYIDGEQLDRYADRQQLDLNSRLRLFLEICGAVEYAHQNLVVHRDLKPANILVTSDGVPKLLDFGIAKLLNERDISASQALTRVNDRLLTPEYASPEQILGEPVTTATDVYALGILLYELLTGLLPYSVPLFADQLELEQLICSHDPEQPSAAIRRLASRGITGEREQMVAIAQARGLGSHKLHKRLRGDLDAIVMRALRKEPQHRYNSIEQLAADIRRYLENEPVHARQGNWLYYSRRFIRRNTFAVCAGATLIAVGIAFSIAISVQTRRIAAERDRAAQESSRAETVSNFMLEVFSASDPVTSQGHETTARQLLDAAAKRIQSDLTQQPEVRARLLEAIGKSYRRQNKYQQATAVLEEALRVRKQLPDPDGSKTASVLLQLEMTQLTTGANDAAMKTLQETARLLQQGGNESSLLYATVLEDLGRVEGRKGNLAAARKYLEASLALHTQILGPVHERVADVLADLEIVAVWSDDLGAAEVLARQMLSIYEQTLPELHPDRVGAESYLAEILQMEEHTSEAAVALQRVLEHEKLLFGNTNVQVGGVYSSLAAVKLDQGLLDQAESYSRLSADSYSASLGEDSFLTAYQRSFLAEILAKRGKLKQSERLLRRSLYVYAKALPPDHQYVASSEYFLGEVLMQQGRFAEAEAILTTSMNRWKRTEASAWRIRRSQSALGEVLYRQGKYKQAEALLSESYQALAVDEKADRDARIQARERLGHFYKERGLLQKLRALPPESSDLRASR